jgi:gamma-aminobutyric acid type B receptor
MKCFILALFYFSLQKVEPWKLYLMVTGFLLVDLVILLTWQLYDPLQRRIEVFPLEDPPSTDDDIKIRPELEHCESENNNVWLGKTKMLSSSLYLFIIKLLKDTRNSDVNMMMNC